MNTKCRRTRRDLLPAMACLPLSLPWLMVFLMALSWLHQERAEDATGGWVLVVECGIGYEPQKPPFTSFPHHLIDLDTNY